MKLASSDYLDGKVTQSSKFNDLYGCDVVFIGQKARTAGHGALDNDAHAYIFANKSIGLAVGTTVQMGVVEWVPNRRSYLIGAEANAGAVRINNDGIVRIVLK